MLEYNVSIDIHRMALYSEADIVLSASVDTMSAIAYEDAVKQLKSLKEFLATRTVLKDKKALEIVAVVGITRQVRL